LQQAEQLVGGAGFGGAGRDDELRQHVERAADGFERFEVALERGAGQDRGLEEVVVVHREERAAAGRVDAVAGAAEALQGVGDAGR